MRILFIVVLFCSPLSLWAQLDWFQLLNKTFDDEVVSEAMNPYGKYDGFIGRYDVKVQENWYSQGLAVTMNEKGEIISIYFYNQGYELEGNIFSKFDNPLPLDVKFNMDPEAVKEHLGEPTKEVGVIYKRVIYHTNYFYDFMFKDGEMQYMRISVKAP